MKKLRLIPMLLSVCLAAVGCLREKTDRTDDAIPYNPFVEAFTYGKISRTSPVHLIFNQDVDPEKMTDDVLKKVIRIKPSIAGTLAFENSRTIVFKPETEFKRATDYTLTADIGRLFEATGDDREFSFWFSTMPFAVRGNLQSLDVSPENEDAYDITVGLLTPDHEDRDVIEEIVKVSEKLTAEWSHSEDGREHTVIFREVPAGENSVRTLTLSVGSNKFGAPHDEILSIVVPARTAFEVYDATHTTEPERFVEVTFTRPLDPEQQMRGLAFIENNESETVHVEGNKIRLYPDAGRAGDMTVHLSANIRSRNGLTLGEDVTRVVQVASEAPSVRFIGNGVVVPQSSQILVPFQAVYLRGVIVRVIRILENNVGQFLQINRLDESSQLIRVGRLVARKTIFFDDAEQSTSRWGTYAIDLKSLIDPEPGAIYRVELSFNRHLSAYPCDGAELPSREQLLALDKANFRYESNSFDDDTYYYYSDTDYDDSFTWSQHDDPCTGSFFYYNETRVGRNVLASNLGVLAKADNEGGQWRIFVFNLLNARPEKGVDVKVFNFQRQQLASGLTDDKGQIRFDLGEIVPFLVIAQQENQRAYLRVDASSALSLSSFDVSGEVVQRGIKGFIYGDRGVWRPGDNIYLSFMLNDRDGTLPSGHPVVMELYNPLGQLYQRKTLTEGTLGVYAFEMTTDPDAPTGSWDVRVNVGGVSFAKRIRIETIKPNRLKIDLSFGDKTLVAGDPIRGQMHVEWLTGATARNMRYEIDAIFRPVTTEFPKFAGFVFDDPSRSFESSESGTISGTTDAEGNANVTGNFDVGENAPGMLAGVFNTRVFEESGDFSIDALRVKFAPYKRFAGIRSPQQDRSQLNTGEKHTFEAALATYTGDPVANTNLHVEVYKIYWYWWWSASEEHLANFISNRYNEPVRTFDVKTAANGKVAFDLRFDNDEWGTYFIRVSEPHSGHSTGTMAYFDWPSSYGRREAEGSDAAMRLTFTTDKDTYAPGEKITVTIPSSDGALALLSVENGSRVLEVSEHVCKGAETRITLEATAEMQPNVFLHVTLLQPHAATANDLPIRMYGVVPVTVTDPRSRLQPVVATRDEIKPESEYEVVVSEQNGREMAYTLAIVDEGLLDLTRFKTPDPWSAFNAREALGVRTWDMYNYVVGAYGGRIEQLFNIGGGDALDAGPKASVNRFKPVVQFEGPFLLKKGAKKKHVYTMPNYNGRVRVMVIAGDGRAFGNAEKSVIVRKPVMLLGTLPRVIGVNEEMTVPATVFATEKGVGDVKVTISCSDNMEVIGESTKTLSFSDIADKTTSFRIRVKGKPGAGKVTLTAASRNDKATYETDIEIRSVRRPVTKIIPVTLDAGGTWSQSVAMPGAAGTNRMTLEVSNVPPVNLAMRLGYLLGFPHGCIEQITSKGFPQLYVGQFASLTAQQRKGTEDAVKEVLRRMRSYQTGSGGFAYWPGNTDVNAWGTIYATHFTIEAAQKGYMVNDAMQNGALNHLRQMARGWKIDQEQYRRSDELTQAYRLYVLALSGSPELGAMNRLRENASLSSMARWMLAAGYALAGRNDVANQLANRTTEMSDYRYNQYDNTFGSDLRDRAIRLMTLCILDRSAEAGALAKEISETLSSDAWISTQSTAFALMAMSRFIDKYHTGQKLEFSYKFVDGKSQPVSTDKHIWSEVLADKVGVSVPLELKNPGKSALFVRIIAEGTPEQGDEEAYANGLQVTVQYGSGSRLINVAELDQGTNFTAVATVRNPTTSAMQHIVLTQIFPAGWEILNTRFADEGAGDSYPQGVSYQDIRDDRVYTHMDRLPSGSEVTVRINLAATYSGVFYHPPVYAEAMYDNTIRANTTGSRVTVK